MAQRRVWERLAEATRKRYVARGKSMGQSEAQVRAHYESGGSMATYRGHPPRYGVGERMWTRLRKEAKKAELDKDLADPDTHTSGDVTIVLVSLLSKGFSPQWILDRLAEKQDSRSTYRSRAAKLLRKQFPKMDWGWDPGRKRFYRRTLIADIELYYYH